MKRTSFVFLLASISLLVLLLGNCKKDEPKIIKQKVTGQVQKGPYINGTSISMSELNSSLVQTGKIFTTQISNNSGSFEINNISLTSSYVEFSANGYYFDEVKGDISIAPLNLFALSDITDISTVNVNILTHLEKLRVEYLVKQNKTLSEAKKIAQGEILAIFGFSLSEMDDSETLDISVNNEGNAILLAISIILQSNRSVGDLTELLAGITNDIREDGILNSESIMTNLRNSTKELVLATIRTNLVNRYQNLGISASIPEFEKYVNDFSFTTQSGVVTLSTTSITSVTATSASSGGSITADGGAAITVRGVCWSTSQNPTTTDNKTNNGAGTGSFTSSITGLKPNTTYYVRAYATNNIQTTYGNQITLKTISSIQIDFTNCTVWANYYSDDIYIIDSKNQLFKSTDNCKTWNYISNLGFTNYSQLEVYENIMYATDRNKIYKSIDQGISWLSLPDLGETDTFTAFDVDLKTNDVYASTAFALFRFDGKNWSRIKTTTGDNSSECIAVDHNGNLYYDVYLFTIYKSIDKGVTWSTINYNYESNSWSTTGAMYVTDENVLLMNRWWNGVYKLIGNDCVSLNNGLLIGSEMKGTRQIVTKDENYYTVLNDVGGILGIYFSANRGLQWNICNYNLTPYDLRYFVNMAMNKTGTVVISIKGNGCYKLNKELYRWDLIQQ